MEKIKYSWPSPNNYTSCENRETFTLISSVGNPGGTPRESPRGPCRGLDCQYLKNFPYHFQGFRGRQYLNAFIFPFGKMALVPGYDGHGFGG